MVGAPVSTTFVPGAGACEETEFAAYPRTEPSTRQAKPLSSSMPFANTYALARTSGTSRISGAGGAAAFRCGVVGVRSAPKASVPEARSPAKPRASRKRSAAAILSRDRQNRRPRSTPLTGEEDGLVVARLRLDDGEDRL